MISLGRWFIRIYTAHFFKGVSMSFIYKSTYWKNQMINANSEDTKLEVAGNFAHTSITHFTDIASKNNGKAMIECLKEIDKHARWMVSSSDGISNGYRLTCDWMRTIIAQITLDGAKDNGQLASECEKVIGTLWNSMGWSTEASINPVYTDVNTLYPIKYNSNGEDRTFSIALEPTGEFPIGAMYKAKTGTNWSVIEILENSILCEGQEICNNGSYPLMPFGKSQLRGWERLN